MRKVPDCFNCRYKALDDLIQELSMATSSRVNFTNERTDYSNDPSIRLMCEFWDILKENPHCNLTQAVKHRMGLSTKNSTLFGPRHVTCYMANSSKKSGESSKKDTGESLSCNHGTNKNDTSCCEKCSGEKKPQVEKTRSTDSSSPGTPEMVCQSCKGKMEPKPAESSNKSSSTTLPLQDKVVKCPKPKGSCDSYVKNCGFQEYPSGAVYTPEIATNERPTPREPVCPSRNRVTVIVPKAKDRVKDKPKEINAPTNDAYCENCMKESEMKAKDYEDSSTCKRCSAKDKMKSISSPPRSAPSYCCGQELPPKTDSSALSKALCCLKQAASHDKHCNDKIQDLLRNQTQLKNQIQELEEREKQGLQMLKKADGMWTCMEDCYKKKLKEAQQKQKDLLKEMAKVEQNNNKWRKTNKELELQMTNLNKLQQEMTNKMNQKKNDIKVIDNEIENLKKRIDNYYKETDANKKSMDNRKNASNIKITNYCVEINKIQEELNNERKLKNKKEEEGAKYIREAREDMQEICKILLQKKLQNEDLRAEKKALDDEIELLKQTLDQCRDKCSLKQKRMDDEIKKLTDEINEFQSKCIRCNQITDTDDIRKLCSDCPKCEAQRLCKVEGDHCEIDHTMDCVCQSVKQKFLDNVFENMYTVLARQSKTATGKAVADAVLKCLKKGTNGKLNEETRKILQEFILTTVKKNLNLTIVGGAVKTRCEMDNATYDQLMSCLKNIEPAAKPPKEDKGTAAKKASCRRWGGTNECNCPHGPKACVCTKKAPPPLDEPGPNPPPDADDPAEVVLCPHKDKVSCGVECAMHGASNEHPDWKRDPCKSPTKCSKFSTNMRAAQCVLGPEALINMPSRQKKPSVLTSCKDKVKSKNDEKHKRSCTCEHDHTDRPIQIIIEEVMGKYREVTPIENVSKENTNENEKKCLCGRFPIVDRKYPNECNSESDWIVLDGIDALKQKLLQKRNTHICQTIEQDSPTASTVDSHVKEVKVLLHPKNNKLKKDKSMITDHSNHISKIAKDLMADVIVSDYRDEYVDDSKIKWMTTEAFIKQISSHNLLGGDSKSDVEKEANYAKQLKAEFWEKTTDNDGIMSMLKENKDKHDAYTEISPKTTLSQKMHNEYIFNEDKICSNGGKKCLKIIFDKYRSNSDISLTKTTSGNLGVMLNENIIKIIDQMTLIDPQLIPCFDRDKKLSFHYERSGDDNEYDISLKRTSSGTRQIEVDKLFIHEINTKNIIIDTPIQIQRSKHDKSTSTIDLTSNASKKRCQFRSHLISMALTTIYDESKSINLTVQGENGLRKSIDVPLTKTLSGNIAVEVNKVLNLGEIAMNLKEYPVKLSRIKTNYFLLKITKNDENSNAMIRNTCSGSLLLLPSKPVLKCTATRHTPRKEKYFEMKIKDRGSPIMYVSHSPFIVKPTSSQEYLVVVDKEHEKSYKKVLSDCIGNDSECCIKLMRTKSSNFEVHVDETNDFNARMVKSPSGELKITCEKLNKNASNKKEFKTLHDLLESSSISGNELRKQFNAPQLSTKFNSDYCLLDRVKIWGPDNKELILQPSKLRKTDSGQYAIILNKSSKKNFINNMKIYLKNDYCHGLIPVKRTNPENPGEFSIALGSDHNKETGIGSLKVTHSGNVYLIINKTDVATRSKIDKKNITVGQTISFTGIKSQHYIEKVQQLMNKAVATNCNAYPDSCLCDPSKCLCIKLHTCTKNGTPKHAKENITSKCIKESLMSFYKPQMCGVDLKRDIKRNSDRNCKITGQSSKRNGSACKRDLKATTSSDIAMEKNDIIQPVLSNHSYSTQQCLFVDTMICSPHHVDQNKCASNNLLIKLPDVFDKSVEDNAESSALLFKDPKYYNDLESLENLPPQLPYFLRQSVLL